MSYPLGSVQLTGNTGTTDVTDVFPTHLDYLGLGGMRTVANTTERNAIPLERRAFGMLVFSVTDNVLYILANLGMGGADDVLTNNSNWIEFAGGSGTNVVVLNEIPSPSTDGSTKIFTVTHTPAFLTVDGQVLSEGYDYSVSGNTVTLDTAPQTGAVFLSYFTVASSASGTGISWVTIAGTTQQMLGNVGYIALGTALTTFTLPIAPNVGDVVRVCGEGGLWSVVLNSGQKIVFGNLSTAISTGTLDSTDKNDAVELLCVNSTTFKVISVMGDLEVN